MKGHQSSPDGGVSREEEEGRRGGGGPACEGAHRVCVREKATPEKDSPHREQSRRAAAGPRPERV